MENKVKKIDKFLIKIGQFSAELPGEIEEALRTLVTTEIDLFATEIRDNQDGTFDKVFKGKVNGTTIVKQGDKKDAYVCKSKRSPSQRLRSRAWAYNPDDNFYEGLIDRLINNFDEVVDFLKGN